MGKTRFALLIATAFTVVAGVIAYDQIINPAKARDCSANAVVQCGVWSVEEMRNAYNSDRTPGIRNIFAGMGISGDMINGSTVREGLVHKDGRVTINGTVVAVNSTSAGRLKHAPNAVWRNHGGTVYYESSTSEAFLSQSISAYILLDAQGRFQGAVLKDCGNPVRGVNVVPNPPEPVAECKTLTANLTSVKINQAVQFNATVEAKNGATLKDYTFDFGDGKKLTSTSSSVSHSYSKSGTYNISVVPSFNVNGNIVTSVKDSCKKTVTVVASPGVSIDKTVNSVEQITTDINKPFTYELVVKNTGDVELTNVKVTDPAPKGVKFQKADKGDIANNQWSYTIPKLAVGASEKFKITAVAVEQIAGQIKNTACVDTPTVPGTPDDCDDATVVLKIKACNIQTGVIETVTPGKENTTPYTTDLTKCEKVRVCDITTKTIVTVTKHESEDTGRYASEDSELCKPVTTTPPELPTTGPTDVILGSIGLGALVTTSLAYIASRRMI